jgi:hypothetical protein
VITFLLIEAHYLKNGVAGVANILAAKQAVAEKGE